MKLVIDRRTWDRGGAAEMSKLLRYKDGIRTEANKRLCCLGFLAKACGAEDYQILNIGVPATTPDVNWLTGIFAEDNTHSLVTECLIQTNDSSLLSEEERERKIINFFSFIGVQAEFIN